MLLSFIIPTYNRKDLIQKTLDSIVSSCFELDYEVIIIDDCSQDNTEEWVKSKYNDLLECGIMQYHYLEKNIGVTGAKNYGANRARGQWLVFLDSDDLFIKESKEDFLRELACHHQCGVVFFRCNTFDGHLLGKKFDDNVYYDLHNYITLGFPGECLPVIKKEIALKFPYEEKLRGFEHIAYFRMLKNSVIVCCSTVVSRMYRTENEDRLSSFKGRMKRAEQFYAGYKIALREYNGLSYVAPFRLIVRIGVYFILRYVTLFVK